MRSRLSFGMVLASALMLANQAIAQPFNEGPPSGNVVLDLDGTAIPHSYQAYTTANFMATSSSTNISFAFREDPAFISLDDVTVLNVTTGSAVPLVNGGFELGILGDSAPVGWTYLNIFGAFAGGVVNNEDPHSGSNNYFDGAVQAYDAIT